MGKELSMVEKIEQGRIARKYFINCERLVIEALMNYQQTKTPSLPLKKTQKSLPGCLSLETQDDIKQLINDRAAELPREKQAGFVISMWSALGAHFEVKKAEGDKTPAYKHIPEGARLECLSLIARLSVDNLVTTMTKEEFSQLKALPKPEANCITISLGKGSDLKTITLKFDADDTSYNRWFVCNDGGDFMIKPMLMDEMSMTFEQWTKYATQERGYIVLRKAEVLSKLESY